MSCENVDSLFRYSRYISRFKIIPDVNWTGRSPLTGKKPMPGSSKVQESGLQLIIMWINQSESLIHKLSPCHQSVIKWTDYRAKYCLIVFKWAFRITSPSESYLPMSVSHIQPSHKNIPIAEQLEPSKVRTLEVLWKIRYFYKIFIALSSLLSWINCLFHSNHVSYSSGTFL